MFMAFLCIASLSKFFALLVSDPFDAASNAPNDVCE